MSFAAAVDVEIASIRQSKNKSVYEVWLSLGGADVVDDENANNRKFFIFFLCVCVWEIYLLLLYFAYVSVFDLLFVTEREKKVRSLERFSLVAPKCEFWTLAQH